MSEPMSQEQATFNDLSNRVARSCVAVVDTVVTRGGFKGEELTTIGQLRDQAIQGVVQSKMMRSASAAASISYVAVAVMTRVSKSTAAFQFKWVTTASSGRL